MHILRLLLALVFGLIAGVVNAIAGGGTLITYPALVAIGLNPIAANATSTIALWPGYASATVGYRRNLAGTGRLTLLLSLPALAGGGLGAFLLLRTPTRVFEVMVPFLLLGATVLLAFQGRSGQSEHRPWWSLGWTAGLVGFLFAAAVYGGYFGAGLGFLLMAGFGLFGMREFLKASGLRSLLTVLINGVAAVYFAVEGRVRWPEGLAMAVGAIAGAYMGATWARRLGGERVRRMVVVLGFVASIYLFVRAF